MTDATDVTAELASEQQALDRAVARLAAIRAEAEAVAAEVRTAGAGGTRQGRLERDIRVTNAMRRLGRLNIGSQPLAIGRIDLDDGQTWRIGRVSVDDSDREPLIVDWRAPAAQPFYRATPLDPCGVVRRRHYQFAREEAFRGEGASRRLAGMQDELLGEEPATDGPELVLVGEGALLAALSRRRTGRMADIVATIQRQQDEVIRAPLGGVLVVQGGPGTGKTAVALHRAAYLLYAHPVPLDTTGLLLVGPNPLFLKYVEQVLPSLGEHTVVLATPASVVSGVAVTASDRPEAARVKGDLRMVEVVRRARALMCRPLRTDLSVDHGPTRVVLPAESTRRIVTRARRASGSHARRRRLVEKLLADALMEEKLAALKRLALTGRISGEASTPDEKVSAGLRRELLARPEVRAALDRMWPELDGLDVVRGMWASEALLKRACEGVLDQAETQALIEAAAAARGSASAEPGEMASSAEPSEMASSAEPSEMAWSAADAALVDEARALVGPPDRSRRRPAGPDAAAEAEAELIERVMEDSVPDCPRCAGGLSWVPGSRRWYCQKCDRTWKPDEAIDPASQHLFESVYNHMTDGTGRGEGEPEARSTGADRLFGHVLVDEAQELSPMQWRMLARRCPSRSLTVTGDLAQASGAWAATAWAEALIPLMEGSAVPMSVTELTVNYRTPEEVMELAGRVLAEAGTGQTPPRSVRRVGTRPRLVPVPEDDGGAMVAAAGTEARGMAAGLDGGRVGVIAPVALLPGLRSGLADITGGSDEADLEAPVAVLDAEAAKGLEFDGVVVVDPAGLAAEQPRGLAALYVALTRTTESLCLIGGQSLTVLAGLDREHPEKHRS